MRCCRSLGQDHVLPLLALALKARDLRCAGMICGWPVTGPLVGVRQALPLAADLARAAARLRAVAPKLRAKGAARAVDLFLSRDALAPGRLTSCRTGPPRGGFATGWSALGRCAS
jgi:hypothetical protein